mmetsp:Transcript_26331/g.39885  ORF Transcript_26331/g.39885 Transcript_26331/m.39885 type:complete len:115 (-) Transcript_26331:6-350(-)
MRFFRSEICFNQPRYIYWFFFGMYPMLHIIFGHVSNMQQHCFIKTCQIGIPPMATNMGFLMFNCATSFNGDVSTWKTENVESMTHMFQFLQLLFAKNLLSWNVLLEVLLTLLTL